MYPSQETIIHLPRLMMSVSSFSEDSLMVQEPTSASCAPNRTTLSTGNKLVITAQLLHALEPVTVPQSTTARCTSLVAKTTKIINFATCGASILPQRPSLKSRLLMTRTSHPQEVDTVPPSTRVKCTFSEESLSLRRS